MSHKGQGEENRLVLLMLGRDDLSALGVTSANPPSCQTLTLLHVETANPSGSAIPPCEDVREVLVRQSSDERGGVDRAELDSGRPVPAWLVARRATFPFLRPAR